ncbi:MAG: hypothetical protein KKA44_15215 [Alphaproteobacteria bacterium]|nr:hypothetical protein [Alphaproteobacteria bacterium]MBU0864869.1 hypothetical protein [Alphaproteobacteria bacterium]MBU1826305.1 hypothetical protein [Alphaproteobacteria bacterium]
MKLIAATLAALLPLSACAEAETPQAEPAKPAASEPKISPSIPISVKEARRGPVDLTPYIGKYPFDVVSGHRFLDHPSVKAAIAAAVPDADARAQVVFADNGLGLPIARVAGGRILAWGGARRAEDRYNWSVVVAPDGTNPEVCVFEAVGDDPERWSSTWYAPGQPTIMKQRGCPSAAEDYPAAEIVAG